MVESAEAAVAASPRGERRSAGGLGAWLYRLRAVVALVVLVIVFSVLSPSFFTTGNLVILLKHVALNAILAVGMTFVVLTGGIDLSVGAVAGLAGMIAGMMIQGRK